ncbi:hypothetical protein [Halocatena pleomorpha]|uniref:PIN domain-containing protein n=1 Tax=Halocatena pleomorpha TaxID=1785090 RepID=A0A3P3RKM6_9EURY|nr:hypothetical protein [Halocatena pleomorpha]RRJ33410.1 hypothetical protein EIK79_00970 [Halocatena pleomorpha]
MYVETDFLLALIKDDDWLSDAAETVYREHRESLWTSQFTLIELLANASSLIDVRSDVETVVVAASHVEEHGFTPFDALHLVESDGNTVVSSDGSYEGFAPRLDLNTVDEQA